MAKFRRSELPPELEVPCTSLMRPRLPRTTRGADGAVRMEERFPGHADAVDEFVARAAAEVQCHRASRTCYKNVPSTGAPRVHPLECRMYGVRPAVAESRYEPAMRGVLLRRDETTMTPYAPFVMAVAASNQAMYVNAECSRYATAVERRRERLRRGMAPGAIPALPASLAAAAALGTSYSVKYSHKDATKGANDRMLSEVARLRAPPGDATEEQRYRLFVTRSNMFLLGQRVFNATQVALYLTCLLYTSDAADE